MGDPSGIGPAIALKAINALRQVADFVLIGDAWVWGKVTRSPGHRVTGERFIDLNNVGHKDFEFGKIKAGYGRASVDYLDKALELARKGEIDCLVTCPISKEAVNRGGLDFSGHTEYLAKRTNTEEFVMMLLNKDLKISLVTRHIPLNDVSWKIDKRKIKNTIVITQRSLRRLFNIAHPRIAVCGLNPHASDNGSIGDEENKVIKPALKELRLKIDAYIDGPISSDVAIFKAYKKEYDCVIAMYHDQALIPLKLLGSDTGVNMTLGLPFVRTSPLHGTAFDIARNYSRANPSSLIEAIKLAVECTLNQRKN